MANETALMPHIVADTVIRELAVHLHETGKAPWLFDKLNEEARDLADVIGRRAAAIYCANADRGERFAQDLRKPDGRDTLYGFTRHWLTDLFHERYGQAAVDALPADFSRGRPAR